jgi:uncharacterized membrane protein YGL010W
MFVILIMQDSPASITGHFRRPPVKTLTDHLATYASYHRDRRNIATHFIGIPMIVVAIMSFLARPALTVNELPWLELTISPALVLYLLGGLYYLWLDLRFGLSMALLNALALWLGLQIAALDWSHWLGWSLGIFIGGWTLQALGHYWEGRKPAFMDDIRGLAIGPLFVVAEAGFALGFRREVAAQIEESMTKPGSADPVTLQSAQSAQPQTSR